VADARYFPKPSVMDTERDGGRLRAEIAPNTLDIAGNRAARKWTRSELLRRAAWELLRTPLFAWTPRPLWAWRCAVLRLFGARIGQEVHVHPTVTVAIPWNLEVGDHVALGDGVIVYNLGRVRIGARATISQYAHLCAGTHDYRRHDFPLVKSTIEIGEGAWICADAFVGPDVVVGDYAILGARAVAMSDVTAWTVAAGNPARFIRRRPLFATENAR
jgi:putative colanic acid biosynthesis acetyltransferase WcaF